MKCAFKLQLGTKRFLCGKASWSRIFEGNWSFVRVFWPAQSIHPWIYWKIYQNCNVVLDNTPPSIGIGDYRMIASEPTNLEQHQNQRRWRPGGEEQPSLWSSTPFWAWYPGYLSDNKSPPPWCGQETPLINADGTFGPHTGAPPQCLPFLMELLMETFSELISIGFVEAKNGYWLILTNK